MLSFSSIDHLCISYLRNFLQMMQTPAFAPYAWFSSTYFGPLQAVFLILVYMQNNHDPESEPQALYLVDEVIDFFVSEEGSSTPLASTKQTCDLPKPTTSSSTTQLNLAWPILKSLRISLSPRLPSVQAQPGQQQQNSLFSENYLSPISMTTSSEHISTTPLRHNFSPLHTCSETPTSSANLRTEPSHFQIAASNALSPLFTRPQGTHDTFVGVDDDMDVMGDFSDLDAWSDSLVQPAEDDLPLMRIGRNGVPDVSFASPISPVKTPPSVAGRSSGTWPSKNKWGHDIGAQSDGTRTPRLAAVGTVSAREAGGGVGSEANGGGRSTPHLNSTSGNSLADAIIDGDLWMDL